MEIFFEILVFIVGACLGSFGYLVAVRLPRDESIIKPSSHCDECQKKIPFWLNIPLISFLFLRGKCFFCHKKLSYRYFLVEFTTAFLFWALYKNFGFSITFFELAYFVWAGVVVSVIDLDHRILPDAFTLSGIIIGLAGSLLNPDRSFYQALLGVVAGGGSLWLVAYLYFAIKNQEGMGGGDIKLIAWIGAVLGWKAIIFTILVSSLAGSFVGLIVAFIQRSGLKTSIPFGPFLFLAALTYIFWGEAITQTYLNFFFPFVES